MLSQYQSCSVTAQYSAAAAGCKVAVCEAQCVVGSVIRPVDPSLPPTYTHSEVCGHTAGPVWPTTPTSPLPLSGWDDRCREQGEKKEGGMAFHWLLTRCGLSVCLSGWNVLYIQWMDRETFRQTWRMCLCILK